MAQKTANHTDVGISRSNALGTTSNAVHSGIEGRVFPAPQLLENGNPVDAEQVCRKQLSQVPDDVTALYHLGLSLLLQERYPEGEKYLDLVLDLKPDNENAQLNLAIALANQGKLDEADHKLSTLLASAPANVDALVQRGIIAATRGKVDTAEQFFLSAIAAGQNNADAYLQLGKLKETARDYRTALKCYKMVLLQSPDDTTARSAYLLQATILMGMGRTEDRKELYQDWLQRFPGDVEAEHMLASCSSGHSPAQPDATYIKSLFDNFAENFDTMLLKLNYLVPDIVKDTLAKKLNSNLPPLSILDAGCGTGLCGKHLLPYARSLVGVDISPGMLQKAGELDLYDELIESDLCDYLALMPNTYDLIVCADTVCYFGELNLLMENFSRSLRADGQLIFTAEKPSSEAGSDFSLNTSGRYQHNRNYLEHLMKRHQLTSIEFSEIQIREQKSIPVNGFLVYARKRENNN